MLFHPDLGSFFKRGAGTSNPRLAHVSAEAVGVVARAPMQDATVVPENSVAGLPSLGPAVFRLGREIVEFVNQPPAVDTTPTKNRTSMGADVIVAPPVVRVGSDELLFNWRQGRGVFVVDWCGFGTAEDVVVEYVEVVDLGSLRDGQPLVGSALAHKLGLTSFGGSLIGVKDRYVRRHEPE